ncbi:MAG: hypothetical protein MI745_05535 [Pseudomonadales bacterium]|nr:hypothetical protein [Pseudomonadales bacterium]
MNRIILSALAGVALLLAGCEDDAAPQATGADRDEHGCLPSAGYQWCEETGQCERPWELAEREDLEKTPEAFAAFCGNPSS